MGVVTELEGAAVVLVGLGVTEAGGTVGGSGVEVGVSVGGMDVGVGDGGTGDAVCVKVGTGVRVAKGVKVLGSKGVRVLEGVRVLVAVIVSVGVAVEVPVCKPGVAEFSTVSVGEMVALAGEVRVYNEVAVGITFSGVSVQASHPMQ